MIRVADEALLREGQKVRITDGAFFDYCGIFERVADDERVALLLVDSRTAGPRSPASGNGRRRLREIFARNRGFRRAKPDACHPDGGSMPETDRGYARHSTDETAPRIHALSVQ